MAKAVAKKVENEVSDFIPEWMQDDRNLGKENIRQEDLEIPRLKLMQGLSPELQEMNGLRAGNFLHTGSEYVFGGPFRAVPVYFDRRYILWQPRDAGGGILARADDGIHWQPANQTFEVRLDKKDGGHTVTWKTAKTVAQSGLDQWGTMDPNDPQSPPAATLMYNFLLVFPDNMDLLPALLTFQKTAVGNGKKFLSRIKGAPCPSFGRYYEFGSFSDRNPRGQDFFNISVPKVIGAVQSREEYELYKGIHAQFADQGVNIKDIESLQEEEETPVEEGSRGGKGGSF